MKVKLWGTRGSFPIARQGIEKYGGNTSCVEVAGSDGTLLILDAGTGIRALGEHLNPGQFRVDILLSHLHMDHILGLGFFKPIFHSDREVHIWGPPSVTQTLETRLGRYLSPPLFPVRIRDFPCNLRLHEIPLENFKIGEFEVVADLVSHPGLTVGFRITEGDRSMAYLPDHEPALCERYFAKNPEWTSGFSLAEGTDLLIHDAQYSPFEYPEHLGWGHSTFFQSIEFAAAAGVKRMVPFHHDPAHDDLMIDRLDEEGRMKYDLSFDLLQGPEGACFELKEKLNIR